MLHLLVKEPGDGPGGRIQQKEAAAAEAHGAALDDAAIERGDDGGDGVPHDSPRPALAWLAGQRPLEGVDLPAHVAQVLGDAGLVLG